MSETTTIPIESNMRDRLRAEKTGNETYTEVIGRLLSMNTLTCPDCETTAVKIIDDNGVTNPEYDRRETYECENGHVFNITLRGSHD